MAKKKDKPLDPNYKKAKMGVLGDLHSMASDMMADDLKKGKDMAVKKVSVVAPDKEHLVEGLDKAKELLGDEKEADEGAMDEDMEEEEEMASEKSEMSAEDIDAKIAELMELKKAKMKG